MTFSLDKLKTIIPKIERNIAFRDYLLHNGYRSIPDKDFYGFVCYVKEETTMFDIVFIGNLGGHEFFYSSTRGDTGNIVDFVKNRLGLDGDLGSFAPDKDSLVEACKKLIGFLNSHGKSKAFREKRAERDALTLLSNKAFTTYYQARPISDPGFFKALKINEGTVTDPVFSGKMFNAPGPAPKLVDPGQGHAAFPIVNRQGNESGLYLEKLEKNEKGKDQRRQFFAPASSRSDLWLSNNITSHGKQRPKLTIVESPLEALAHFQFLKENRYYASIFEVEEATLEFITSILKKERATLYLALNATIASFVKEIRILLGVLSSKHDLSLLENNQNHILIHIGQSEEKYFKTLIARIKRYNNSKIKAVVTLLGDSCRDHLRKDLMDYNLNAKGNLLVRVPKDFRTLYGFEKILVSTFPGTAPLYVEKPMWQDWIAQNMKSHRGKTDLGDNSKGDNRTKAQEIFIISNNHHN